MCRNRQNNPENGERGPQGPRSVFARFLQRIRLKIGVALKMGLMRKVFEALEAQGFLSEDDLSRVKEISDKDVVKLHETLYSTVLDDQYPKTNSDLNEPEEMDPFSFVASASIRADSGCQEPECRIHKLDFLARFSALYATSLILPLQLTHPDDAKKIERVRGQLYLTLTSMFVMRPLIEQGLATPVTMTTKHCEHVDAFIRDMSEFVHQMASWAAKDNSDLFTITYQQPEHAPRRRSTVYIEGPEEFLDHGELIYVFDETQQFRAKSWRYDAEGKVVLKGKRKQFFLEQIFNTIENDTTFYLASGHQHRARLLTDRSGDAYLLDRLNQDKELQTASMAMELLSHSIPLLGDVPLSTVIRIRREERDSFEAYRRAITELTRNVLSEKGTHSTEELKEAFKTKLEPQIEKVRAEVNAERSRQSKRFALGISSVAAAVLMGACGGLPLLVKGALAGVATASGGSLLSKAAASVCEHGSDLRLKNDLYFLLRLLNE